MKKMDINTEVLSFKIPPETKRALERRAKALDINLSEFIRQLLEFAAQGEVPEDQLSRRIAPSGESYSVTVANLVKESIKGVTREVYMLGYRDGMSIASAAGEDHKQ